MLTKGQLSVFGKGWVQIELDYEIGQYYRRMLKTEGLTLQRPSNKEHITIVCPKYESVDTRLLYLINGREIYFQILPGLFSNGNAYWYDVQCKDALQIRKSLSLGEPVIPLHFCIGYLTENGGFHDRRIKEDGKV